MMDIDTLTVPDWFRGFKANRVLVATVGDRVIAINLDMDLDLDPASISWADCEQVLRDHGIDAAEVTRCWLQTRIGPGRRQ